MKKLISKVKGLFGVICKPFRKLFSKFHTPKFIIAYRQTKFKKKYDEIWAKYPLLMHVPLSLAICFLCEWLSRHSFVEACGFVSHHLGPYLYNSLIVFALYSVVFLVRRQQVMRILVTFVFLVLGVTNCIVLLNRVTPFGYVDLYMVGDLLTMQDSKYFTAEQATAVVIALVAYGIFMIHMFRKGKKEPVRFPFWSRLVVSLVLIIGLFPTALGLREVGVLTSYFGNLAQGYLDYGYLYGFSTSVFDRGMSKPFGYSANKIASILDENAPLEDTYNAEELPNIIVMLYESVYDVSEAQFLHTSEDPLEFYHYLEDNYSTGHLTVPVVGAGTCNSEFEVLTGMSCQFLGPGEYPQKTILKEVNCESYADILGRLGYGTHVVHNNGGNFYSRANAFSMMGFDTFSSKEMLDITDYTPLGSWPTDDILIGATTDSMNTTEGQDFIYTITVGCHGAYPTYEVESNPRITVTCDGKTEGETYAWSYYVNRLNDDDDFLKSYVEELEQRDEPTLLIVFGDHLPTMGLTEDEIATGDLYQTKYITWNNFGMEKVDKDLTSYQLVSTFLGRLGIHDGTLNSYHQSQIRQGIKAGTHNYMDDLEMIQYDLLYGQRYCYDQSDRYPASDLEMGVNDVVINKAYFFNGYLHIYGENFTKWSKVFVNGEKVSTTYESGQVLKVKASSVENGSTIVVNQLGSSDTIFRSSNEYVVFDPNYSEAESSDSDEISEE